MPLMLIVVVIQSILTIANKTNSIEFKLINKRRNMYPPPPKKNKPTKLFLMSLKQKEQL